MREPVLQRVHRDRPESAADVLQIVFPHQGEGFFLGTYLLRALLVDAGVDPFDHPVEGVEVALGCAAEQGSRDERVVPQLLSIKTKLLQFLLRFLVGDLLFRHLVQQQGQPLAQLLRLYGFRLPAPAVFAGVFAGEPRSLFQILKLTFG